jgi:anthranilate/para-aminobenzoate synthase component II
METDVITDSFEYDASQIVVEDRPGDSAQCVESLDVSPQEALQCLVKGKACIHGPGPGEDKDEAGEVAARVSDADLAEVAPINLCLLFMGSFP